MYQHRKLFRTLVLVGLVATVAKCLRFRAWKMNRGPEGKHEDLAKHWHKFHGPKPPWFRGWEKPSEEEAEQVELAPETAAAKA